MCCFLLAKVISNVHNHRLSKERNSQPWVAGQRQRIPQLYTKKLQNGRDSIGLVQLFPNWYTVVKNSPKKMPVLDSFFISTQIRQLGNLPKIRKK